VIVSVEVAEPPDVSAVVEGDRDVVSPVGEVDVDSVIVPVNWLRLLRVTVDVPGVEGPMIRLVGLLEMLKSGVETLAVRVVVWVFDPLVPVTLTV
jgi:hypothetical protein